MFTTIPKSHENYQNILNAVKSSTRQSFDYNALIQYYNKQKVGQIVQFPRPANSLPALVAQLEKRGLVRGTDYNASIMDVAPDGQAPDTQAFITKLTDKDGAQIEVKRGRPPKKAPTGASGNAAAG